MKMLHFVHLYGTINIASSSSFTNVWLLSATGLASFLFFAKSGLNSRYLRTKSIHVNGYLGSGYVG